MSFRLAEAEKALLKSKEALERYNKAPEGGPAVDLNIEISSAMGRYMIVHAHNYVMLYTRVTILFDNRLCCKQKMYSLAVDWFTKVKLLICNL